MKYVQLATTYRSTFLRGLFALSFLFFSNCSSDNVTPLPAAVRSVINSVSRSWMPETGFVKVVVDFDFYNANLSIDNYKKGKPNLQRRTHALDGQKFNWSEGLTNPDQMGVYDLKSLTVCGIEAIDVAKVDGHPSQVEIMAPPVPQIGLCDVAAASFDGERDLVLQQSVLIVPIPKPESINPSGGSINGGTQVKISGRDLPKSASVKIGGSICDIQSNNDLEIECTTRAHAAGLVDVVVADEAHEGMEGVLAASYRYADAPQLTGLSQNSGVRNGGYSISVLGSGIQSGATVTFNGISATVTGVAADGSSVTVTFPDLSSFAPGTPVVVVVTNTDGQSGTLNSSYTMTARAPQIASVSPSSGSILGGTSISVNGSEFQSGATISIGGNACGNVIFISSVKVTCVTPAGASANPFDVTLTNPDAQSNTLTNGFTYLPLPPPPAPTLSSVSPNSGPEAGGTLVTITGTNLSSTTSVSIGGTSVPFTVVNGTSVTATTPAGSGSAGITVVTTGGSASLPSSFSYEAAPTITGISPNSGPVGGGFPVTITGTNLSGGTVTIGGNPCVVTASSPTSITCTAPAGGGAGGTDIVVTTVGGTVTSSGGFTYVLAPTIASVSPSTGPMAGGGTLTVTGSNLSGASVTIGGTACTGVVANAGSLTCTIPAHSAGTFDVAVSTVGGNATATGAYTYYVAPTITSVSPNSGPLAGGFPVTITGTGLTGGTVTIGGNPCVVTASSPTSITCTAPAGGAGGTDVVVTTPGGTVTSTGGFTYVLAPTIASVSPSSGPTTGGGTLTITGTNLGGATVSVGGSACTSPSGSAGMLTCTIPMHSAGTFDVVVTTVGGSATSSGAYTYYNAPTITLISPNSGPLAGGFPVTITGTNLNGGSVTIGGNPCVVTASSPTSITCTAPVGSSGGSDVVVTAAGGTVTSVGGFTYVDAPTIGSISPNSGPISGGFPVTITGTNLSGGTVTIGGNPCVVTASSPTSITCSAPAGGGAGGTDVVVTTVGGTVTSTGGFTYVSAPTIASVSPSSGSTTGGGTLTITGTNLSGATVTVAGTACSSPSGNATTLTCTIPAHSAGTFDVVVTTVGGSATSSGAFTYVSGPSITSVSPNAGPVAGGTSITITGTNLSTTSSLTIGGTSVAFTVVSETSVTATTPVGSAGSAAVVLTTVGGPASSTFTYVAAPTIGSISPNSGPLSGGGTLTITGTNLSGATVSVGGAACTSPSGSATMLTCTLPAGSVGSADVVVTTVGGTVTSTGGFTYVSAPTIASVSPSSGSTTGGGTLTITGTNLSGATVTVAGTACSSPSGNATTLTCTVPAHSEGTYDVVVTTVGGSATSTGAYTYVGPPTLTGISPSSGAMGGGYSVVISGTGLSGGTVNLGSKVCAVTATTATSITCTVPAVTSAGDVPVVVSTPGGSPGQMLMFTYLNPPPTVTSNFPPSGPASGGTVVTVSGSGFRSGASVRIGGSTCTGVSVSNANSLMCTTSGHAAGAATIVVTNTDLQASAPGGSFTYIDAPTLTSVSGPTTPAVRAGVSGLQFHLVGTGFYGTPSVSIGGINCVPNNVTSTVVDCVIASGLAQATHSVQLMNPDSQPSNTLSIAAWSAPTVSGISPNTGSTDGGLAVTITGTNFHSGSLVYFGSRLASNVSVVNSTTITAQTPVYVSPDSLTQDITVLDAINQSGTFSGGFTYSWSAPVIVSLSQASGAPGTSITLTGSNFASTLQVKFFALATGNQCGSTINVSASSTLTSSFATPNDSTNCPAGTQAFVVAYNPSSAASNSDKLFTFDGATPVISSLNPSSVQQSTPTLVTITGSGFAPGLQVLVNGSIVSASYVNSTTATFTSPVLASTTGNVPVVVRIPATGLDSAPTNLIYLGPAPTLSSISPNSVVEATSNTLTVSGSNLSSGMTLSVTSSGNTFNCASYNYANVASGSFTCIMPALTYTGQSYSATITNSYSQTASLPGALDVTQKIYWALRTCASMLGERREFSTTAMDDGKIVIWGGVRDGSSGTKTFLQDGVIFDPSNNSCTQTTTTCACSGRAGHSAQKMGSYVVLWGGYNEIAGTPNYLNTGCRLYVPGNSFQVTAMTGAPSARAFHSAADYGGRMLITMGMGPSVTNDSYTYDININAWFSNGTVGPSTESRIGHSIASTGSTVIVWGGKGATSATLTNTGYKLSGGIWSQIASSGAPEARQNHSAVYVGGQQMIVFGGSGASNLALASGAIYNIVSDTWSAMPDAVYPRTGHSAVWTGSKMIVWNGFTSRFDIPATAPYPILAGPEATAYPLSLGEAYTPGSGWSNLQTTGDVPPGTRPAWVSAVWNGTSMFVTTSPLTFNLASPSSMAIRAYTP